MSTVLIPNAIDENIINTNNVFTEFSRFINAIIGINDESKKETILE